MIEYFHFYLVITINIFSFKACLLRSMTWIIENNYKEFKYNGFRFPTLNFKV